MLLFRLQVRPEYSALAYELINDEVRTTIIYGASTMMTKALIH